MEIAILIPCLNEQMTIAEVVRGFSASIPEASLYVYDNDSTDSTVDVARDAGAIVRIESNRGKGNVVRRMFAEVDADVYVLVDGDGTYDSSVAKNLVNLLQDQNLDMVVASRANSGSRAGHTYGNRVFNWLYRWMFGSGFTDIFSGYRVFNRGFVKSFPVTSNGFEIETEMSVHASQLRLSTLEVETTYGARPEGSKSKLRTFYDGWEILKAMIILLKDNRPFFLFGVLSCISTIAATAMGIPVIVDYVDTGLVERLPTAVLATGFIIVGLLFFAVGLILEAVTRSRIEFKRIAYLQSK
ncbi:MAG: glycosyl transferase [Gammaproteobacteria bacterium]|nr:glycosyl transferase [Gammaproteobacteria bacterium]